MILKNQSFFSSKGGGCFDMAKKMKKEIILKKTSGKSVGREKS
jgi:hypothetical protein